MATPVPKANGFAAALETFLSRGGSRLSKPTGRPGMRFSEGPIRGKTVEQATEMARGMWAKASPALREKYAGREAATMAPSERTAYRQQIAGVEPAMPGQSGFSAGTRRASPGDLNGDGAFDAAPAGASRGTAGRSIAGISPSPATIGRVTKPAYATPEENARARQVAAEASGQYGETAALHPLDLMRFTDPNHPDNRDFIEQERRNGRFTSRSTDKSSVPGMEAPANLQTGGSPSRASLLGKRPAPPQGGGPNWEQLGVSERRTEAPVGTGGAVQVGTGKNAGKMNPLTGRPIGYVPPAQTLPGIERPSAGMSFDPKYGAVPKASEVPEAPMTAAEYGKVRASQDVNDVNALDPTSPEASAARGRMRTYEEGERAKAAAVARRERVGPSPAERDAQQRQAARALDRRVAASYGRVAG